MTDDHEYVLEFCDVTANAGGGRLAGISNATFRISKGEIVLVSVDTHGFPVPLFDLAEGLIAPDSGTVTFMGENWQELNPAKEAMMRGHIGRTFETQGWISSLSLCQNICLSQRHHTHRFEEEIRQEAEQLARTAGLEDIPEQRPEFIARRDSQKFQWVRAFMGSPALVLLEHPEAGVRSDDIARLFDMTEQALQRGAAVVWITANEQIRQNARMRRAARYSISDGKLLVEAV